MSSAFGIIDLGQFVKYNDWSTTYSHNKEHWIKETSKPAEVY